MLARCLGDGRGGPDERSARAGSLAGAATSFAGARRDGGGGGVAARSPGVRGTSEADTADRDDVEGRGRGGPDEVTAPASRPPFDDAGMGSDDRATGGSAARASEESSGGPAIGAARLSPEGAAAPSGELAGDEETTRGAGSASMAGVAAGRLACEGDRCRKPGGMGIPEGRRRAAASREAPSETLPGALAGPRGAAASASDPVESFGFLSGREPCLDSPSEVDDELKRDLFQAPQLGDAQATRAGSQM